MNKYIFFLGLLNILYPDFPLNGQSWIFVEGGNPNAFSILEDVNPKRIFWVYFEDDNNVSFASHVVWIIFVLNNNNIV